MKTELEKKQEELIECYKAHCFYKDSSILQLESEIAELKKQQEVSAEEISKEQLLDWVYKMGILLDKKVPLKGHNNLQRIEIAVRSYAQQGSKVN